MKIRNIFHQVLVGILLLMTGPARAGNSPFDVGDKAQLFIDKLLVRDTERVWFTLHPGNKHPDNPLLKADQWWEGPWISVGGTVLFDEQENIFKMWYTGRGPEGFAQVTCYAISPDGIQWEKPRVSQFNRNKNPEYWVTFGGRDGEPNGVVAGAMLPSVIKDLDDPDPNRRYKMICWNVWTSPHNEVGQGYSTMVSPDGLDWKFVGKEPIAPFGDVITGYWDPYRELYVAFPKIHFYPFMGHYRRVFNVIFSRDFEEWTDPVPAFRPDARDDAGSLARIERVRPVLGVPDNNRLMRTEFYGIGVYPHESCTIGFPRIFTINNNNPEGTNQEGPNEVQLAVSRDLVHWERPFRMPIIDYSEPDAWDSGAQSPASFAIRVDDEIRLYYGASKYTHATPASMRTPEYLNRIGLVTWKLDRFVSVDGPAEGGTLTTVPLKFSGKRLEINAVTKPGGSIVVELLDAAGRPLEGYSPSDAFSGDDLRHIMTFQGRQDVSSLAGSPVTLRFHLKNAGLYSFAFRQGS